MFVPIVSFFLSYLYLGRVYAVGRPDYGRLGLGSAVATANLSVCTPTMVHGSLADRICVWIGVGEACSYAVDSSGEYLDSSKYFYQAVFLTQYLFLLDWL